MTVTHDPTPETAPVNGFVNTPTGRLHYIQWPGDGPDAHFLHGNGLCAGTYAPFLKLLARDLALVASDVRGHGDSELNGKGPIRRWAPFAEDLKTVVESTLRPPVIGIGHSLGAVVTAIAAARFPHLFHRIILLDPVILPARILWLSGMLRILGLRRLQPLAMGARRRKRTFAGKDEALRRFLAGRGIFRSWSPPFIASYLECAVLERDPETATLKCDPETEAQIFESVPLDIWRTLRRIQCPVHVLRGEHSDTFLPDAAARIRRTLPGSRSVTVPDTGHFLPMEAPRRCARLVREAVASGRPNHLRKHRS